MYPVKVILPALPQLNMPDVCVCQPLNSENAFCKVHTELAKDKGYPTKARDFVEFYTSAGILYTLHELVRI